MTCKSTTLYEELKLYKFRKDLKPGQQVWVRYLGYPKDHTAEVQAALKTSAGGSPSNYLFIIGGPIKTAARYNSNPEFLWANLKSNEQNIHRLIIWANVNQMFPPDWSENVLQG